MAANDETPSLVLAVVPVRWRDDPAQRPSIPAQVAGRRRRVFLAFAMLLVIVGAVIALITWLRPIPAPYLVPLWVSDYEARSVPRLPLTGLDREAFRTGGYFTEIREEAFNAQEQPRLMQQLNSLRSLTGVESVVLYLSAHACADENGQVVLLPADFNPATPASRVPLKMVLESLKACPNPHKLLILDIMWPLHEPRLGVLANDSSARVRSELENVPDRHRLTLCASTAGQHAFASEDLGKSVFAFYLEQGLRGWADPYNPRAQADGRVMVRELAEFVRARVDRWSMRNRGVRQTPVLIGDASDFPLLVLSQSTPLDPVPAAPIGAYPAWLTDAWKLRDQWLTRDVHRTAPRLFQQLDATLFSIERDFRAGVDVKALQESRLPRLDRWKERLDRVRAAVPQPEPRSLALAVSQGRSIDRSLVDALQEFIAKLPERFQEVKPEELDQAQSRAVTEFLAAHKERTHFDLAWAAFELLSSDPTPTAEEVRWLNRLLQAQEADPVYAETLFLRRLAALAAPSSVWPQALVRQALQVVRTSERAAADPQVFVWLQGPVEDAAQARHNAEALLFARGFVSIASSEAAFAEAARKHEALLYQIDALTKAQGAWADAMIILPAYAPFAMTRHGDERTWQTATRVAADLSTALELPVTPPTATDLQRRLQEIRQRAESLQSSLELLRRPFQTENLNRLTALARRGDTQPVLYAELEALLETSILKAEDRRNLWQALRAFGSRLAADVQQLDEEDDRTRKPTPAATALDSNFDAEQVARPARVSLGELRLAKLPEKDLVRLEDRYQEAADVAANAKPWSVLADLLRQTWNDTIPQIVQSQEPLSRRLAVGYLVDGSEVSHVLDAPETNPAVQLQRQRWAALYSWLADRNRYLGRDVLAAPLHVDAARDYADFGRGVVQPAVQIQSDPDLRTLGFGRTSITTKLLIRVTDSSGKKPSVEVQIFPPDERWLQVTPDLTDLARKETEAATSWNYEVPLQVTMNPAAERSGVPRPSGILARITVNGRAYHHRIPWPSSEVEPWEILVSTDPMATPVPLAELRLRPVRVPQSYAFFIRNPLNRDRKVTVELTANEVYTKTLTIVANQTEKIRFEGAAPKADAELPELKAPLRIRLLDPDKKNKELDARTIQPEIAWPREYVKLTDVIFTPTDVETGKKNQLTVKVQATVPLGKPPCTVELVLPPARIPGLIAIRDGTLRGVLPEVGEDLTLFAKDIQLEEGGEEDGFAFLTVDGNARAFVLRTTFARRGAPTRPREEALPTLQIKTGPYALAGPKFAVDIEADNAPTGSTLEFSLGTLRAGQFEAIQVEKRPRARQHRIGFSPLGPDGAWLFDAVIRDWNIVLDTSSIRGPRALQARLLDASGLEIQKTVQTVIFGDAPPARVQFVDLPRLAKKDSPLVVRAAGTDAVADIKEVVFFLGKPAENKIPPMAVQAPGQPANAARTLWIAQLALPDKKGQTEISVQFTNSFGVSTFETANVELVEFDPVLTAPGRIVGSVWEGTIPVQGLVVELQDEKGKKKDEATTGMDGSFEFKSVPPGRYTLYAFKQTTKRKKSLPVNVEPGKKLTVRLELFL